MFPNRPFGLSAAECNLHRIHTRLTMLCCRGCCGDCVDWLCFVSQPPHALDARLDVELLVSDFNPLVDDTAPSRALSESHYRDSVMCLLSILPQPTQPLAACGTTAPAAAALRARVLYMWTVYLGTLRNQHAMLISDSSATCTDLRLWWVVIRVQWLFLLSRQTPGPERMLFSTRRQRWCTCL